MLIILYGKMSTKTNPKNQKMIDGKATCGYREYARNFGHIIYLSPQKVQLPWEHNILKPKKVIEFISKYPDSIVWSVKHDPQKDVHILSKISNKKIYYSCNSNHRYNNSCDINLVDTVGRIKKKKRARVWFKGKDPEYWKYGEKKKYDYLLIGKRGDKNEVHFINKLNQIKSKRNILWIGGKPHQKKFDSHHNVKCTEFLKQDKVRDLIPTAKVGVLFTDLKIEGFPQTFLEMTMCGVPVVYNIHGPTNDFYFHKHNSILCKKKALIQTAEKLLKIRDSIKCREEAIENYSIQKSYEGMKSCLK